MSTHTSRDGARSRSGGAFEDTLWNRVSVAGMEQPGSPEALEALCQSYWFPIYGFLRRWGHDRQNARDLTQGFFGYVIKENLIRKADPDRGRFRCFLLGILKNFVCNQRDLELARKRGSEYKIVSIDEQTAEGLYAHEPVNDLTPEKIFERRWALTVLGQALERLKGEYARAGMTEIFEATQPWITGDDESGFAELGAKLQKSEGAARVLVFRLRNRFRDLIREVIADTVTAADQIEIELKHLQMALRP